MWEYQHSVETTATQEALWRRWSDMAAWPGWNDGIEKIEIDGPFAVGTTFTMTPPGDEPVRLRIVEMVPGESFTDQMDAGDFAVRTTHRLEPLPDGRTRVIYRTEITGPAADQIGPQLGPAITSDFPEVLAALVKLTEAYGTSSEHLAGLDQLPPIGARFTAVPLRIEGLGTIPVRAFARLPE